MRQLLFIILLVYTFATAQILQWSPTIATVDDSITIIYDATQGNAGLVGETEIYAHTGVLTAQSDDPSDWKSVKTSWGQNTEDTRLTPLGNDKWQIRFHIRTYYGIPQGIEVTNLAFVFRNSTSSKTGKTASGGDIFLPIYPEGLNVALIKPTREFLIVQPNQEIHIIAAGTQAEQVRLYLNGVERYSTSDDTLRYTLTADNLQRNLVSIIAENSGDKDSTGFYFLTRPEVSTAELPTGLQDGMNDISETKATLVLHAPNKNFVYVIGDFNDWMPHPDFYMQRTPDESRWWLTIDNLQPNKEYIFQYFVDDALRIADPYAEKLSDPWHDKYISQQTYPGLLPYPADKTTGIASYLETNQTEFNWQDDEFVRPQSSSLVIYELHLRDFIQEHTFDALFDSLAYLKKLGINAIELMPITEFEGNSSWGYNPSFYFAVDKYYGPAEDLKKFINACHQKGIAVILDMVYNHSTGQHSLAQLYWDNMNNRPSIDNLWYNDAAPAGQDDWGFLDFNHESEHTQAFFDRVNRFWLQEFHVDGFRFDFTKGFTNNPGNGDAYDSERIAILKRMADNIWQVDEAAFVILEHWGPNTEEKELAEYGMMLWGNANYNFNEASMGYHEDGKSNFRWASYQSRGWSVPNLVSFMESHDEERLMFKNLEYGNSSGSYSVQNIDTALERMQMAGAFLLLLPGPKMLWQFGEIGYDFSIDYNGRVGEKPIRWDYFQDVDRKALYDTWSNFIHLKTQHPLFDTSDFTLDAAGAVKTLSLSRDGKNAIIVGNFDVVAQSVNIELAHDGTWYDYLGDAEMAFNTTNPQLQLEPGEFHIFMDEYIPVAVEQDRPQAAQQFKLYINYPNPFNPSTTIRYELDQHKEITLEIYDILGKKVKTLFKGVQQAGMHAEQWNATSENGLPVASGIYIVQLQTKNQIRTQKITLIR